MCNPWYRPCFRKCLVLHFCQKYRRTKCNRFTKHGVRVFGITPLSFTEKSTLSNFKNETIIRLKNQIHGQSKKRLKNQ